MKRKEKSAVKKVLEQWALVFKTTNGEVFCFFNEISTATGNLSSLKTKPTERWHGYRLESIVFCAVPNTEYHADSTFSKFFQPIGAYLRSMPVRARSKFNSINGGGSIRFGNQR